MIILVVGIPSHLSEALLLSSGPEFLAVTFGLQHVPIARYGFHGLVAGSIKSGVEVINI